MKHACLFVWNKVSLCSPDWSGTQRDLQASVFLVRGSTRPASPPRPQIIKKHILDLKRKFNLFCKAFTREAWESLYSAPVWTDFGRASSHLPWWASPTLHWPEILCVSEQNKLSLPLFCFLSSPFDFHWNENVNTPKEMQRKQQQPSPSPERLEWLDENWSVPLQPLTQAGEQPCSLLLAA